MVSPYVIAGGIVVVGGLLFAATARASESDCEVVEEWVVPYGLSAVLMRRCTRVGRDDLILWDVALIEDVEIGDNFAPVVWPDESLFHGQGADPDSVIEDAMAWVDLNVEWLQTGAERGPLAERVEDFLTELTPSELAEMREIFRFDGTAVSDAWPYVDRLRTSPTDDAFLEVARQLGNKLSMLSDDERSMLQSDILANVGLLRGLTLKTLLSDAGIL